jgi:diacylglycerol kinase family enzyme
MSIINKLSSTDSRLWSKEEESLSKAYTRIEVIDFTNGNEFTKKANELLAKGGKIVFFLQSLFITV